MVKMETQKTFFMGSDVCDNEGKKLLKLYEFALYQMKTRVLTLQEELAGSNSYNPIEHVKSRLKTWQSVINKCKRKGVPLNRENIHRHVQDVAGVRLICSFRSDIYRLAGMLMQHPDLEVIEYKDYIENPKPNGYQSFHLVLEVPVVLTDRIERMPVELQIRTVAMDFWASLEHKIYYKQNLKNVPASLTKDLQDAAKQITALDEKMENIFKDMQDLKILNFDDNG